MDRGADTRACIDLILEFRASMAATDLCPCGNHDDWMFRSYSNDAADVLRAAVSRGGAAVYRRTHSSVCAIMSRKRAAHLAR